MAVAWRTGWRVPDRREIYEWAEEHVILPAGVYTVSGAFSVKNSRYLIEPFRALKDDRVRVVTVQFPIRAGKTLIGDVWLPWTLLNAPGPFMWNMNTDTLARRHCRTRALPVLQNVRGLEQLLPLDPRQRTGQEIIFRNGVPFYIQCPSIDNLQGVGVRYLLEDELWTREAGRHEQAVGRLGDYEKINASKLLNAGQGGIEDDDSDTEYRAGSQEEWWVPCLECGQYFIPVSTGYLDGERSRRYGLIWGEELPDGGNTARDNAGNWVKARVMETARYRGPCGHEMTDCGRTHVEWNRRGEYRASNPSAPSTHRSFHIYGTVTRAWHLLAEQLAAALNAYRGGILDPLMIYTQKRDALAWAESRLTDTDKGPTFALESPDKLVWADEVARVLTVDKQAAGKNWGLVFAIGKTGELRRYWFGQLISDADIAAKADEWKVPAQRVVIDAAWESKQVYAWCVKYGWRCMKGDPRASFIHLVGKKSAPRRLQRSYSKPVHADPEIGQVLQGRRFAILIHWSNPTIKDRVKGLLDRGRIIEPEADPNDPMEKEYKTQMRGQWRKIVKNRVTGRSKFEWVDNGNDHVRDCWNMGVVVATMMKLLPDIEEDAGEEVGQDVPAAGEA